MNDQLGAIKEGIRDANTFRRDGENLAGRKEHGSYVGDSQRMLGRTLLEGDTQLEEEGPVRLVNSHVIKKKETCCYNDL